MEIFEDILTALCDDGLVDIPTLEAVSPGKIIITYKDSNFTVSYTEDTIISINSPAKAKSILIREWCRLLMSKSIEDLQLYTNEIVTGLHIHSCSFVKKYEVTYVDSEHDTARLLERLIPLYKKTSTKRRMRLLYTLLYSIIYVCDNFHEHCYVCGRLSEGFCGNAFCRHRLIEAPTYYDFESTRDKEVILPSLMNILTSAIENRNANLLLEACPSMFKDEKGVLVPKMRDVFSELKKGTISPETECLKWWLLNLPAVPYRVEHDKDHYVIVFDIKKLPNYGCYSKHMSGCKSTDIVTLYHGAPIYAWISILNNGLHIMSDTPYMINGAVYGRGIYASSNMSTAKIYSHGSSVAEVEVIRCPISLKNPTGDYFVIMDTEYMILKKVHIFN